MRDEFNLDNVDFTFWLGDDSETADVYRDLRNRAADMGYACVGEALDALEKIKVLPYVGGCSNKDLAELGLLLKEPRQPMMTAYGGAEAARQDRERRMQNNQTVY